MSPDRTILCYIQKKTFETKFKRYYVGRDYIGIIKNSASRLKKVETFRAPFEWY